MKDLYNTPLFDDEKVRLAFKKVKKELTKMMLDMEVINPDNNYSELESVLNINNIKTD